MHFAERGWQRDAAPLPRLRPLALHLRAPRPRDATRSTRSSTTRSRAGAHGLVHPARGAGAAGAGAAPDGHAPPGLPVRRPSTSTASSTRHVVTYLADLSRFADIYYLADCELEDGELDKMAPYTKGAWAIRHGRYDFGSYSMLATDLVGWDVIDTYDEMMLANDSCWLVQPLDAVFAKMDATDLRLVGPAGHVRGLRRPATSRSSGGRCRSTRSRSRCASWTCGATPTSSTSAPTSSSTAGGCSQDPRVPRAGSRPWPSSGTRPRSSSSTRSASRATSSSAGYHLATFVDGILPYHPVYRASAFELMAEGFPLLKRQFLYENPFSAPDLRRWKERVLEHAPDADVEAMESQPAPHRAGLEPAPQLRHPHPAATARSSCPSPRARRPSPTRTAGCPPSTTGGASPSTRAPACSAARSAPSSTPCATTRRSRRSCWRARVGSRSPAQNVVRVLHARARPARCTACGWAPSSPRRAARPTSTTRCPRATTASSSWAGPPAWRPRTSGSPAAATPGGARRQRRRARRRAHPRRRGLRRTRRRRRPAVLPRARRRRRLGSSAPRASTCSSPTRAPWPRPTAASSTGCAGSSPAAGSSSSSRGHARSTSTRSSPGRARARTSRSAVRRGPARATACPSRCSTSRTTTAASPTRARRRSRCTRRPRGGSADVLVSGSAADLADWAVLGPSGRQPRPGGARAGRRAPPPVQPTRPALADALDAALDAGPDDATTSPGAATLHAASDGHAAERVVLAIKRDLPAGRRVAGRGSLDRDRLSRPGPDQEARRARARARGARTGGRHRRRAPPSRRGTHPARGRPARARPAA